MLGPGGGNHSSWAKPLKNFTSRCQNIAKANVAPSVGIDLYSIRAAPTMSYVAQLCDVSPECAKQEFLALQRILHLPHNTFPKEAYYYLHQGGLRKITPLRLTARAAIIRTAHKTCTVWKEEGKSLNDTRSELAPLQYLSDNPTISNFENKWWKSRAFVDNLAEASDYCRTDKIETFSPRRKGKFSIQSHVAKQLAGKTLHSTLAETLAFRIPKFLSPIAFTEAYVVQQINSTNELTKKMPPSIGLNLAKTWANGWTTDHRLSLGNSPCRFGCLGTSICIKDDLSHYLDCPRLHNSIVQKIAKATGLVVGQTRWDNLAFSHPCAPQDNDSEKILRIFKASIAVDTFQIVAAAQRKYKEINVDNAVDQAIRKLNAIVDWRALVHKHNRPHPTRAPKQRGASPRMTCKKLANKKNCSLPTRVERGEKRKTTPQDDSSQPSKKSRQMGKVVLTQLPARSSLTSLVQAGVGQSTCTDSSAVRELRRNSD
jgi:hypothetical protein